MWKQLLIIFSFWHGIRSLELRKADTTLHLPISPDATILNYTVSGDSSKPPVVNMHGHNNYHAAQLIFYIYGSQDWKQQSDNSLMEKTPAARDYLVTPGIGTHKLHLRKLKWNKARKACIEEGGHLAIINSLAEEEVLLRLLNEKNLKVAWLGVHDLFEEGDWVTVHDQALEKSGYSRWTTLIPNEPDNFKGQQHCGALMKGGGMDDDTCQATLPFFCEISPS